MVCAVAIGCGVFLSLVVRKAGFVEELVLDLLVLFADYLKLEMEVYQTVFLQ